MKGFVDLHCHWIHSIDDGALDLGQSHSMLQGLYQLGFSHVVATPHMRPGMFDNSPDDLKRSYRQTEAELRIFDKSTPLPRLSLASEHFFSPEVMTCILSGEGLPYDGEQQIGPKKRLKGTILIEFQDMAPLRPIESQLQRVLNAGYLPLIAHPERYSAFWREPYLAERLLTSGYAFLLDTAALSDKYGRQSKKAALKLLELGIYAGACSDAHRPKDIPLVAEGMQYIRSKFGAEELQFLFMDGPLALLSGLNPIT